jgi:hypothetical protein
VRQHRVSNRKATLYSPVLLHLPRVLSANKRKSKVRLLHLVQKAAPSLPDQCQLFRIVSCFTAESDQRLGMLCFKTLRSYLSFTPGFSPETRRKRLVNRFNGLLFFSRPRGGREAVSSLARTEKPLKRFLDLVVARDHRADARCE